MVSTFANMQTKRNKTRESSHRRLQELTLTAVPTEAPRYISGLYCPFLTGLQQNKQPLQLEGDTSDWILFRLLKLPAEVGEKNFSTLK